MYLCGSLIGGRLRYGIYIELLKAFNSKQDISTTHFYPKCADCDSMGPHADFSFVVEILASNDSHITVCTVYIH